MSDNGQSNNQPVKADSGFNLVVRDKANNLETKYCLEDGKEILVGAGPDCAILIDDEFISSRHFSVKVNGGKVEVKDLGSKNGLFVRIDEAVELLPGQVLLAGKTTFELESNS